MTSPEDVIYWARKLTGRTYLFGGELTGATPGPCDCSELVEYACRNAGAPITDGSWLQFQACDTAGLRIPFDRARRTPGALLFMSRTLDLPAPRRPQRHLSRGDRHQPQRDHRGVLLERGPHRPATHRRPHLVPVGWAHPRCHLPGRRRGHALRR